MDLSLGAAFLAGLLSFLAPCVLPLVPGYLAWLAGVSLSDPGRRGHVLGVAVAFVLGFSTIFILLGATASAAGRLIASYFGVLTMLAGAVIILFGLHFLGLFRIALFNREARLDVARKPPGPVGAYVMGLAFGFGWTPCAGPILSVILFMAGAEQHVGRGIALLGAYSAGLGLPFLAAAGFAGPFGRVSAGFRPWLPRIEKGLGLVLVAMGVLVMTGTINRLGFWLYEAFPMLSRIG